MKAKKLFLIAAIVTALLVLFAVAVSAEDIEIMLLDGIDGNLFARGKTITYTGEPLKLLTGSTAVGGADDPDEAAMLKFKLADQYGLSPNISRDYAQPQAWFAGWNTDALGNGEYITEINEETYPLIKHNTLYAMWACPFKFNASGGVFTDVEGQPSIIKAYRSVTHDHGADGRVYGKSVPTGMPEKLPVKEGFRAVTARAADVNATPTLGYLWLLSNNGDIFTVESPTNTLTPEGATGFWFRLFRDREGYMEFFVIWIPQIRYNANNGTDKYVVEERREGDGSGIVDQTNEVDTYLPYLRTYTFKSPDSLGMTAPEGKTFIGWNTKPDGSGKYYQPGKTLPEGTNGSDVAYDLYAIWSSGETHTVTVNGGTASPDASEMGKTITLTVGEVPEGKAFSGWTADIESVSFAKNTFVMPDEDVVISAVYNNIVDKVYFTGFEQGTFGHHTEKLPLNPADISLYVYNYDGSVGWICGKDKGVNGAYPMLEGTWQYSAKIAISPFVDDCVFTNDTKVIVDATEWTLASTDGRTAVILSPEYEISLPELPFTDIIAGSWYHTGVAFSYVRSIMSGVSGTEFAPNASTTRGMIVTILYALEGKPKQFLAVNKFTDVAPGSWYEKAVIWADDNGIANGYGEGVFAPNENITREQLALILYKYAAFRGFDVTVPEDDKVLEGFPDVSEVSSWAVTAVKWAINAGMISGVQAGDEVFIAPKQSATRAMVSLIMLKFIAGKNI
ncbi:MAG: S-layer homology domain-containing protein [Clostridia bacterium]|nr:S-layer homology domain-containing protein [Clostridia bacterium]